jgi:hypothetical protein
MNTTTTATTTAQAAKIPATHVEVSTTKYEFAYGHKPRGRGYWVFQKRGNTNEMYWAKNSLTYGEAKKLAIAWAQEHGYYDIEVCS